MSLFVFFLFYTGRYFACSTHALAVNVFAKRPVLTSGEGASSSARDAGGDSDRPSFMYYVNDGIYGSFNCIMFDHYTVVPALLQVRELCPRCRSLQILG